MVPPPRPAAPVIERVLALEPADEGEWAAGVALALSPVQSASVATALAGEELTAAYAIDFAPGATMSVARADLAFMRALAGGATPAGRWLDGSAAAVVAAVSLAGLANERFLESLGDEMRELKSLLAGLAPKIDGLADGRLKALVQDLSRFAREARENYASAIGKAAFRERIEDACERALNIWRDAVERVEGARQPLETLARAPRFGEVQVEKALALMRALHEQKRIQEISARILAAACTLRIAVGDSVAVAQVDPLASAAAALQGGIEQDGELFARLVDCEKAARGDPYVGKGEFEANRAALRKLIERPPTEPFVVTLERIAATRAAEPLDPPRGERPPAAHPHRPRRRGDAAERGLSRDPGATRRRAGAARARRPSGRARHDARAGDLLLRLDQRRHELPAVAEGAGEDQRLVHRLADHRRHRQALGEVGVVADVLARVVELEAERAEIAVERLRHHLEQAGVDRADRDQRDQLLQVDAGARADGEGLGGGGADRLGDEVVEQLDVWPAPGPPTWNTFSAKQRSTGSRRGEGRGLGADHHVELAQLGLDRRARERRVDQGRAGGARRRRAGRAVESGSLVEQSTMTQAAASAGQQALGTLDRGLDLGRAGDAQEDDVRGPGERRRRRLLGRARRPPGRRRARGCGARCRRARGPWPAGASPCRGP